MMEEAGERYLPLARGTDDKAKDRAVVAFADAEERAAFYAFFKQLQALYDILSPDAFLRPFIEDYQALGMLYGLLRNYYDRQYVDRELAAKTRALLREQTATYSVELPGAIHELGPRELAALKASDASDTAKVLNLRKVLAKPFLRSIGERAEEIAKAYEERQLTTQAALAAFEELAQEYLDAEAERERLGLEPNAFAIHVTLKRRCPGVEPAKAAEIDRLFAQYPEYVWNETRRNALRTAIYKALKALHPVLPVEEIVAVTDEFLRLQRV